MRDFFVLGTLVLGFALWVTAHMSIVVGLLAAPPRWRAPLALVIVPFAPYWAVRSGMRARSVLWALGALVYLIGRVLATR